MQVRNAHNTVQQNNTQVTKWKVVFIATKKCYIANFSTHARAQYRVDNCKAEYKGKLQVVKQR